MLNGVLQTKNWLAWTSPEGAEAELAMESSCWVASFASLLSASIRLPPTQKLWCKTTSNLIQRLTYLRLAFIVQ